MTVVKIFAFLDLEQIYSISGWTQSDFYACGRRRCLIFLIPTRKVEGFTLRSSAAPPLNTVRNRGFSGVFSKTMAVYLIAILQIYIVVIL